MAREAQQVRSNFPEGGSGAAKKKGAVFHSAFSSDVIREREEKKRRKMSADQRKYTQFVADEEEREEREKHEREWRAAQVRTKNRYDAWNTVSLHRLHGKPLGELAKGDPNEETADISGPSGTVAAKGRLRGRLLETKSGEAGGDVRDVDRPRAGTTVGEETKFSGEGETEMNISNRSSTSPTASGRRNPAEVSAAQYGELLGKVRSEAEEGLLRKGAERSTMSVLSDDSDRYGGAQVGDNTSTEVPRGTSPRNAASRERPRPELVAALLRAGMGASLGVLDGGSSGGANINSSGAVVDVVAGGANDSSAGGGIQQQYASSAASNSSCTSAARPSSSGGNINTNVSSFAAAHDNCRSLRKKPSRRPDSAFGIGGPLELRGSLRSRPGTAGGTVLTGRNNSGRSTSATPGTEALREKGRYQRASSYARAPTAALGNASTRRCNSKGFASEAPAGGLQLVRPGNLVPSGALVGAPHGSTTSSAAGSCTRIFRRPASSGPSLGFSRSGCFPTGCGSSTAGVGGGGGGALFGVGGVGERSSGSALLGAASTTSGGVAIGSKSSAASTTSTNYNSGLGPLVAGGTTHVPVNLGASAETATPPAPLGGASAAPLLGSASGGLHHQGPRPASIVQAGVSNAGGGRTTGNTATTSGTSSSVVGSTTSAQKLAPGQVILGAAQKLPGGSRGVNHQVAALSASQFGKSVSFKPTDSVYYTSS